MNRLIPSFVVSVIVALGLATPVAATTNELKTAELQVTTAENLTTSYTRVVDKMLRNSGFEPMKWGELLTPDDVKLFGMERTTSLLEPLVSIAFVAVTSLQREGGPVNMRSAQVQAGTACFAGGAVNQFLEMSDYEVGATDLMRLHVRIKSDSTDPSLVATAFERGLENGIGPGGKRCHGPF